MRLREIETKYSGKLVKIGSLVSYFYVGKVNEKTIPELDKISKNYLMSFKKQLAKKQKHLDNFESDWKLRVKNAVKRYTKSLEELEYSPVQTKKAIEKYKELLNEEKKEDKRKTENVVANLSKVISEFIPILDREVIDEYKSFTELATCIIVNGVESGEYWSVKEKETKGKVV